MLFVLLCYIRFDLNEVISENQTEARVNQLFQGTSMLLPQYLECFIYDVLEKNTKPYFKYFFPLVSIFFSLKKLLRYYYIQQVASSVLERISTGDPNKQVITR